MESTSDKIKIKYSKWPWLLVILCTGIIAIMLIKNNDLKNQNAKIRSASTNQILTLQNNNNSMRNEILKTRTEADSLKSALAPFLPYQTLIRSISLRDQIIQSLPIKPGDKVSLKSEDSVYYVVSEIILGGNSFSHYIHYKLKNSKVTIESEIQDVILKN
jgi:hypothetical protein